MAIDVRSNTGDQTKGMGNESDDESDDEEQGRGAVATRVSLLMIQ